MLETKYGMSYPFPHTLVHIVDNSAYSGDLPVVTASDPSMYGTLVVSGFPMGEDRSVININRSDILNVAYGLGSIGASDVKKYGQSITYPLSIIGQNAPVQILRVTPEDSTYAYSCITVEWRWDTHENKMHVRYGQYRLDNGRDLQNFQNRERLAAYIKKMAKKDDVTDENGNVWKRRAFIVNVSAGRGSAYNKFSFAINQTIQAKRPANVMYLFSTIDRLENTVVEQFHASIVNVDNKRNDSIEPVNIVIGKRAPGSSVIVPYMNEDAITELYTEYRAKYSEMIEDGSVPKTDYDRAVGKWLTINTFDPVFGLYLYSGTDENNKLPWFQVDMRTADTPILDESQRIYIKVDGNQKTDAAAITDKLVSEDVYGVSIPNQNVYVGDVYLWSTASSKNNPFIYIIAAINQYTGAVTAVRVSRLKFGDVTSNLVTIIETERSDARGKEQFLNGGDGLATKLRRGIASDKDTVAWYNGTSWSLYYIKPGTKSKAVSGTPLTADDVEAYTLTDYNFIDWGTNDSRLAPTLIGTSSNDDAWTRIGATRISTATSTINADGTTVDGAVTINGYDVTDESTVGNGLYQVDTNHNIFKYGQAPTSIDRSEKDLSIVGMQFDVFKCDPEKITSYRYDNGNPVQITNDTTAQNATNPDNAYRLGINFTDADVQPPMMFSVVKGAGTSVSLWERTSATVPASFYNKISSSSGLTMFPLIALISGYLNNGKFYSDEEHTEEITGAGYNIYKDLSTSKYYWFKENAYTEITGLTDEQDQLIYWYESDTVGNWTSVSDKVVGLAEYLSGWSFKFTQANFKDGFDPAVADDIDRYSVIGTLGSIYRVQVIMENLPNDYYSNSYGINVTTTSGGVELEDGSTGFMDDETISTIEYKWRYSALLVDAFRGRIDPKITSPTRCPFKYLFDGGWNTIIGQSSLPQVQYSTADIINASTIFTEEEKDEALFNSALTASFSGVVNKSIDVKQAMYDLMDYRVYQGIPEDKRPLGPGSGMSLHLDSGVTDAATALTINDSFRRRFDNPNASWDIGGYVSAADGVSYTFVKRIVDNLFRHCAQYSVNKPFVMTYSTIKRNEYVSYFPEIDTTDWEYRELMYNSGGNSWIPDVNGDLMRRSQRTLMRGSDTSDLIQESNMRTLTQLVYLLQNKLEMKLFEYNDDSVLRTMQDEVNNMFTNWVGTLVDALNIRFERDINPTDGGELVVCYVDVVFRGINLRIPIIVNVNRRVVG